MQELKTTVDTIQNAPKHKISKEKFIFGDGAQPPYFTASLYGRPMPSQRPTSSWISGTRLHLLDYYPFPLVAPATAVLLRQSRY